MASPERSLSPGKAASGTRQEWEGELANLRNDLAQIIEAGPPPKAKGAAADEEDAGDEDLEYDEQELLPPVSAIATQRPPPNAVQGASGWIYHSTSLGCLRVRHWPRRLAIYVVEHPVFDPLILLTIMCNCSTMAWASPLDPPGTPKEALLAVLEWVYLYIFTFELCTKVVAYGFAFHKHSYIRDAWCQLDFVVVSLAWLPILFPQFGNMSAIRSVRALRPLRALKRVPGMPVLVGSILQSLPALSNVAGLSVFLFLVFGIVGMNLFKGAMHYRCADPAIYSLPTSPPRPEGLRALSELAGSSGSISSSNPLLPALEATFPLAAAAAAAAANAAANAAAAASSSAATPAVRAALPRRLTGRALKGGPSGGGIVSDDPEAEYDTGKFCMSDPSVCDADGSTCFYFREGSGGLTVSFDNVAMVFIPILQVITFDTWTDSMFSLMAAYGTWAWTYFILIAILGGLFVVNLFLAVIFDEFMRAQAGDEAEQEIFASAGDGDEGGGKDKGGSAEGEDDSLLPAGAETSDGAATGQKHFCDCAPVGGWRVKLGEVMTGDLVGNISTGFVVFNLVIMCMPYASQPESWEMVRVPSTLRPSAASLPRGPRPASCSSTTSTTTSSLSLYLIPSTYGHTCPPPPNHHAILPLRTSPLPAFASRS